MRRRVRSPLPDCCQRPGVTADHAFPRQDYADTSDKNNPLLLTENRRRSAILMEVTSSKRKETSMSLLGIVVLVVVVMLLMGTLPTWGHSRNWGYGPSGGLGL